MAEIDNRWQETRGTWDRLRWARLAAGYERAKDFADTMAIKEGTYRAYEREPTASKHSALDSNNAMRFAKKLKVRWEWLLTGQGTPEATDFYSHAMGNHKRILDRVQAMDEKQAETIADVIDAMFKASG